MTTKKSRLVEYPVKKGTKLTATPKDFDYKKHRRIFDKHWASRHALMDHQAEIYEKKARDLRAAAEEERTAGPKLRRYRAIKAQMAKLEAELKAEGVEPTE